MTQGRRVRYAVMGLGYISQVAVLPAFANAGKNSELAALISDDPSKLEELRRKYEVEHTASYDDLETCLRQGAIDAVYIAVPNHKHREYTERAARAGVHVLCEKPMAPSEEDCRAMIGVCREHGARLMIAYRLHFDEANMKAVELAQTGVLGEIRGFHSVFTQQVEAGNIRLGARQQGGGPLYDIGIYCINAARYIFRDEPDEVFCCTLNNGERRFEQSEEMASAILRFPGERVAAFTCSFGAAGVSSYRILGTKGDLRAEPAYEYDTDLKHYLTLDGQTQESAFARHDQFGPQLLYFSDCILAGRDPEPSGEEGLADIRVIEALYRSADSRHIERLSGFQREHRPDQDQVIERPPVKEPELVHAKSPSGH